MFKNEGGGVNGRLNNVQKNYKFGDEGLPLLTTWKEVMLARLKTLFHLQRTDWRIKSGGRETTPLAAVWRRKPGFQVPPLEFNIELETNIECF